MRELVFCLLAAAFFPAAVWAGEKGVWVDEDKDGIKETRVFYDGGKKTRAEVDSNHDGKPDRFVKFKDEKRALAESDKNFDGRIDRWELYDPKGVLRYVMSDTNGDEKPDSYKTFVRGRAVVLTERDRNDDGRIDERRLAEWALIRYVPGGPEIPGYKTIWRERDDDFDGKIDYYTERGNKEAARAKIGKPMDMRTGEASRKGTAREDARGMES